MMFKLIVTVCCSLCLIILFMLLPFSLLDYYAFSNHQQAWPQSNAIRSFELTAAFNSLITSENSSLPIHVTYSRNGGFMGDCSVVNLDTNSLPSAEALQLRNLINSSNFFELPSKSLPPPKGAADYVQYRITIESDDGRKSHTVETNDDVVNANPKIAKLIDFLEGKATKKSCH